MQQVKIVTKALRALGGKNNPKLRKSCLITSKFAV